MKRYTCSMALLSIAAALALFSCSADIGWNSDFILTEKNIRVGTTYPAEAIEADETVYFDFIAASSTTHTIAVTTLSSDMAWDLFTNPSYGNPNIILPVDNNPGTSGDETDTTPALVSGRKYYIAVKELGGTAGQFDILITVP